MSHEKRIRKIPLDMGQGNNAGHGGHGRTGRRGASGRGGCGRNALATMPCKASEQGACKDLEGHIFPIGSGNKGKDGDMLRTSKEKMATYIGTKYGDNLAKDVANDYCKGNQDAYLSDIHEYKPLKLDNPMVAAQGIAFATIDSYK